MAAHLQFPSQERVAKVSHTLRRNVALGHQPLHIGVTIVDAHTWEVLRLEPKVAQGAEVGVFSTIDEHEQELQESLVVFFF